MGRMGTTARKGCGCERGGCKRGWRKQEGRGIDEQVVTDNEEGLQPERCMMGNNKAGYEAIRKDVICTEGIRNGDIGEKQK